MRERKKRGIESKKRKIERERERKGDRRVDEREKSPKGRSSRYFTKPMRLNPP